MKIESEEYFRSCLSQNVSTALRLLLSEKHLYQRVDVVDAFLSDYIQRAGPRERSAAESRAVMTTFVGGGRKDSIDQAERSANATAKALVEKLVTLDWEAKANEIDQPAAAARSNFLPVELPTIQAFCPTCEKRWPCNPGTDAKWGSLRATVQTFSPRIASASQDRGPYQILLLPYQCQQCKGAPITFLVRRTRLKLILCGREPLETVDLPSFIPTAQRTYLSSGIVAHHAGQTLAGLFLLRTFIEQFWLSCSFSTEVTSKRMTGEELGDGYNGTLPGDFKSRFPSLPDLYSRISAAMHSANADATLFTNSVTSIYEHFDARRLFKLESSSQETAALRVDPNLPL